MKKQMKIIPFAIALITAIIYSVFAQTGAVNIKKVYNLGREINTQWDEFAPSLTADGSVMVFNSKRGGGSYQKIYQSRLENGEWSAPQMLTTLSSAYNDETPYITPDGEYILFSSDRDGSFEMRGARPGEIRVSYDIYISRRENGRWSSPIKLPGAVNTAHHERSPAMSPDQSTLYYTAWPFGDIKRAYIMCADFDQEHGEFINPRPMPYPINSGNQDLGLTCSPDGRGFYLSSQRPGGHGGWDLYFVGFDKGKYGEAVNLGLPINSSQNDLHLFVSEKMLIFCSNRAGGLGLYDIYASIFADSEKVLKIIVRDKKTKKPLSVDLNIHAKSKKDEGETITHSAKKRTDEKGEAVISPHKGAQEMDIIISENGYLPLFKNVELPKALDEPLLLELSPIEKEASFEIHAIHFDFESARIKPQSYPYLTALAAYLKKNPSLRFEIIGHTDLHGSEDFNNRLSLDRAQAVKDYLTGRGLDEKRFVVRGAGKSQPRVPKTGAGYDEKNRRTEFKLIER